MKLIPELVGFSTTKRLLTSISLSLKPSIKLWDVNLTEISSNLIRTSLKLWEKSSCLRPSSKLTENNSKIWNLACKPGMRSTLRTSLSLRKKSNWVKEHFSTSKTRRTTLIKHAMTSRISIWRIWSTSKEMQQKKLNSSCDTKKSKLSSKSSQLRKMPKRRDSKMPWKRKKMSSRRTKSSKIASRKS